MVVVWLAGVGEVQSSQGPGVDMVWLAGMGAGKQEQEKEANEMW